MFAQLGAVVSDADLLAREVIEPGSPGFQRIAERWPAVVRDRRIDRAALAQLEGIIHPLVRERERAIERAAPPDAIVIHDIPLLFERGFSAECDKTILVYAPVELRIARIAAREGWSREAIERRIRAQIDQEKARSLADFVIENDADLEHLRAQGERVYGALRQSVTR